MAQEVKLCLLGDAGVGKSSLVTRFVSNSFADNTENTVGASFTSKVVNTGTKSVKFHIWDTAGQEKYRGLAPMYYRSAAAAIIVYDITRPKSFKTLQNWVKELQQCGPSEIVVAIAGNKSDLESQRKVSVEEAQQYADSIGAIFFETSAKKATNVNDVFEAICEKLPDMKRSNRLSSREGIKLTDSPEPKKSAFSWCSLL